MKLEDYFRRENLHFHIIPENARETNEGYVQKVKQVLSDLGAPSGTKFHVLHCTGKLSSTSEGEPRARPILARFVSRMESIWFKRKELLRTPRFSPTLIDKDLSPGSARE